MNEYETMSVIEKPDRRVLVVWRLSTLLSYLIVSFFVFGVLALAWRAKLVEAIWLLAALIPLALGGLTALFLERQWSAWTFQVTPESLEMSHGWLWRQRRIVARDRIQHVDINSGPFDRRFGLVQVVVYTAGTTVGMIPGLRPERAEQLRDQLMTGRSLG